MVSYFYSPYIRNCAAGAANSNQSRDQFGDAADLTFCFRWIETREESGIQRFKAEEKDTREKTLTKCRLLPSPDRLPRARAYRLKGSSSTILISCQRIIRPLPEELFILRHREVSGSFISSGQFFFNVIPDHETTVNFSDFYGKKEKGKNPRWDFKKFLFNSQPTNIFPCILLENVKKSRRSASNRSIRINLKKILSRRNIFQREPRKNRFFYIYLYHFQTNPLS